MSQSFTNHLRLLAAICLTMVCTTRSEAISLSTNDLTHLMGNSNSTAGVLNDAGLRNTTLGVWRSIMPDSRFAGITIGSTQVNVSCYGTNSGRILLSPSGGTGAYTYTWSNGATTQNLLNIVAGPYTVTVTDADKNSASKLFTITEPSEIIAFINCTPVCYGTCNGTASVTVSGGVTPYTYSWSTGSTSAGISGLCPATYWVTVTDGNGCLKIVGGTVCANPQIVIAGTPTNPTCNSVSCDGSISVSASYKMTSATCSNSKPCAFTYTWSNQMTGASISGLCAGTYYVTVLDCIGCSATDTFTLVKPVLTATKSHTNVSCYGGDNGQACITVSSGTGPFTYSWSTGATSTSVSGTNCITVGYGIYSATVTEANGCSATVTDTVSQPTKLTLGKSTTEPTCYGYANGSACVTASGGTPAYTYSWSNGGTTSCITVGTGIYTGTVTDANGCSASVTDTVGTPTKLTLTKSTTEPKCYGGDNGSACVTASGGTPAYTYSWSNGGTTSCITVGAGIYTATVTDANGCSASVIDTVGTPTKLTLTKSTTEPKCYGADNGSACVTASGGTPAYTYSWSNGGTTSCITVGTGIYTGTVTDANGCSALVIDTVGTPTKLTLTKSTTEPKCYGGDNGSACVTASGGTPAYTYSWSNGGTTSCITVGTGIYTGTVTDANGCSASVFDTVGTPTKLTLTKSTTEPKCYGGDNGSACVTASGGTPAYTYSWSNGGTTSCITVGTGIYTGTVTDANGCSASVTDTVGTPTKLTLTKSTTEPKCYGGDNGSACVTASGGTPAYTYSWSNGGTTSCITVGAGIYTATVTDANGCSASVIDTVGTPTKLTLTKSTTEPKCYGADNGSACVTASGGTPAYTYSWSNGGITSCITVGTGIYTGTVTDANGCSALVIDTVGTPTKLTLTKSTTEPKCYGGDNGSACVTASGGTPAYTYSWSNGGTTSCITVGTGIYTGTVTDANGCSASVFDTVGTPTKLTLTKSTTEPKCYGGDNGSACVTASGGTPAYTYSWSNGGTTSCITVGTGIYTGTVTDANGCSASVTDTVGTPTKLTLTKSTTEPKCYGGDNGSACVTASGGTPAYTYSWSNGGTTSCITVGAGIYTATVTDANGCSASVIDTVGTPTKLTLTKSTTEPKCYGGDNGSACVTASGGTPAYTYSWSNGGTTSCITVGTGIYTATVTDANGCSASVIDTVGTPTKLTLTKSTTEPKCYGGDNGSACVTASGGTPAYTYSWSNGGTTSCITVGAGIYTGTVTDANGCSASVTDTVGTPTKLTLTKSTTEPKCYGGDNGSACVTASGGTPAYTYSWSNGGTTSCITVGAGTYTATVTDANGCSAIETDTVGTPAKLTLTKTTVNVTCYGYDNGSACVTASGGTPAYTYSWSNGSTASCAQGSAITNLSGVPAGIYSVTVTDANGCTAVAIDTVGTPTKLTVTKTTVNVSCYGGDNGSACVTASGGITPYTYAWNNGGTASCITGLSAGNDTVTVTDANGCSVSQIDTITQPDSLSLSLILYGNNNCIKLDTLGGKITATVSGGTAPYTYSWFSRDDSSSTLPNPFNYRDSTRNILSRLGVGTYLLTVTDQNGCSITTIASLNCLGCPVVDTISIFGPPAICEGGSVTLSVDSPTFYYSGSPQTITSIEWFYNNLNPPLSTTKSLTTSTPGVYDVQETFILEAIIGGTPDTALCVRHGVDTLKGDTLNISPSSSNPTCYGLCNGSISVSVSGGYTPYSIVWDSSKAFGFTPTGLCAGDYAFTITDANGCSTTGLVTLEAPPLLTIKKTVTNVSCYGGDNGSACVTASGGTPAYTYSWSTGGTGSCITGLTEGYVSVTVTDAYGCSASQTDTITQPTKLTVTKSATPVTCYGYDNGSACVTASGGTTPYTYSWSTGGSTSCITVGEGIYTGTVTDANGCSASVTDTVGSPAKLTLTKTVTNVLCYGGDGSACVTASGGTPAYTYSWSNGGTSSCIREQEAGYYTVTVTDANGCTAVQIDTISQPTQLTVTGNVTNVLCYGGTGSACVTASGGTPAYTYTWSNGSSSSCITDVIAGIYSATVTDANGCSVTAIDTITQPDSLSILVYPFGPSCYNTCDGNALVVVSGGTQIAGETPYTIVWDSSDISGFAPTNLCGGTYCFTVTDANGCTDAQCVVIVAPDTLKAPYTFTNPTCYNTCNGTITVSPTGGTTYGDGAAYNIVWNYPYLNGNLSPTGLCGDSTYCFTVTDQNGCSKTGCVQLTRPDTLKVNVTKTNLTCNELNGLCDGTINVNVSGGTAPYTITWGDNLYGSNSFSQTNLCPDLYCYTVTDANGCSMSGCDSITQPPPFLLASNCCPDQITCHNACNGKITVTVFGGVAPFTYSWSGPAGFVTSDTGFINNLCPGIYTVTVTDANGCTYDDTHAPLINPDSIISGLTFTRPTNCNEGSCNGSVSVSPSGGTAPYTYSWSTGATGSSITGLCGGSKYKVTITDNLGCSIEDSTLLPSCSCPTLTIDTLTSAVTCYGFANGTATISVSGGVAPYTITWVNSAITGFNPTGLAPGTYCFSIQDANGCPGNSCITITQPTQLTLTKTSVNASCGNDNGSACVTASGGTPAYTYSWNTGGTASCIYGVGAGIYTATVTDSHGCSASISDTVTATTMLTVTKTATDVSCYGGTGSACVTPSGGSGVYTYSWSNGGSSSCITGVAAGIYHATVTDGTGCSATVKDTITQPDSLHLTVTTKNAGCSGLCNGSATIVATGGTPAYTIVWDSSDVTGFTPTNLCGGTYCYTVSDVNRCTKSGCITIKQTTLSVSVESSNGSCYTSTKMCGGNPCSGTITLTITGANTYTVKWNGPNGFSSSGASLTGLCGGQYCYTVTAGSCTETGCVTITQPSPLTIKVTGTNNSCGNTCTGTATVTVSSGNAPYTYSWSNGATTSEITGLCASTYTVTVTSSEGCTTSGSICITKPTPFTLSICKQDASCNGTCNGSASVTVCGGNAPFTYSWSDNAKVPSICNLCAGQYCVTVTSATGCTSSACVTICQPAAITLKLCSTNVTCNGSMNGTAGVTVTGGTGPFSYHWSNGSCSQNICGLCAGCYCVTVTSCGGCSASGCVTITQPNPLCVSVTTSNTTCNNSCNGSASVCASGGNGTYTYAWSNGGNGSCDKDLCPGSYSVTVSSAGCCVTKCFTICGPSASIKVCVSGTNPSNGNNGEACVSSVSGGTAPYCYSWSDGKTTCCITCLPAGCYCVTVYDANRCSATACVTLTEQKSNCGSRTESDGSSSDVVTVGEPQINVYPNPFTSYTNIDFILPNDDNVTLEVYSITGVKVAELFKGTVQGGIKTSVRFTNDNLSESMYIYRLVTTDKAMTGNLIIVR